MNNYGEPSSGDVLGITQSPAQEGNEVSHDKIRLQERFELADTSEKLIVENFFLLTCVGKGFKPLERGPEEAEKTFTTQDGVIFKTKGAKGYFSVPLRNRHSQIEDRLWIEREFSSPEELVFFLREHELDPTQERDDSSPSPFGQNLPEDYDIQSFVAETERHTIPHIIEEYGTGDLFRSVYGGISRIEYKNAFREVLKSADPHLIRKIKRFIAHDGKLLQENYVAMIAKLGDEGNFKFSQKLPFQELTHYSSEPLTGNQINSSHALTNALYPEGFQKYLFDVIKSGNQEEANQILFDHSYQPQPEGTTFGYPVKGRIRPYNVFLGIHDSVFLGTEFGCGMAARAIGAFRNSFSVNELLKAPMLVVPGNFDQVLNTMSRDLTTSRSITNFTSEQIQMALGQIIDQSMDLPHFLEYFKRYVEVVFNSEESYWNYIKTQSATARPAQVSLLGQYGLDGLKPDEQKRARDLWQESGIIPPFMSEFLVRRNLNIAEENKDYQFLGHELDGAEFKLRQVNIAVGSNQGFWAEDETRQQWYIKMYPHPSQVIVEQLSNEVYRELGIPVAETKIITLGDRVAFCSKKLPNVSLCSVADLEKDSEFKKYFVVDAYLGNRDVIGEGNQEAQNVVRSNERFYRIDQGGCMIFSAQGDRKDFGRDVAEIDSMRNEAINPAAAKVFIGLDDSDILNAVREISEKITPEWIEKKLEKYTIDPADKMAIMAGLLGRRDYLRERFLAEKIEV